MATLHELLWWKRDKYNILFAKYSCVCVSSERADIH